MLYCYKITGNAKLSCLYGKLDNNKQEIISILKAYFFNKIEICNKNLLCSMMTDNVNLKIDYIHNKYELVYTMFSTTDKYFDEFQKIFSPDDFNLNFIIPDIKFWNNHNINKISVESVTVNKQLLSCEDSDVKYY